MLHHTLRQGRPLFLRDGQPPPLVDRLFETQKPVFSTSGRIHCVEAASPAYWLGRLEEVKQLVANAGTQQAFYISPRHSCPSKCLAVPSRLTERLLR